MTRGHRDELIDFFISGEFMKLPEYDRSILSKENRIHGKLKGWVVPPSCYGWHSEFDRVRREGVRQYIKKHLSDHFGDSVPMIAMEDWRDAMIIYRKKVTS